MAFTKATFDYLDSGGLINWVTTAKTAAFTAVSGNGYLVDTSSAAITVTLPASPSAGDEIIIVDYASNAGTNNITLGRNSLKIRGGTDDLVLSTNNQTARLLYSGATKGWLVTTEAGGITVPLPDLTVDYLVVAGGGGAGGYDGSSYVVGANGGNSTFSSITSTGGGRGGVWNATTGNQNGGSGGGASGNTSAGNAVTTPVTQGNGGGSASSPGTANGAGGGGGGAGTAGGNGSGTVYGSGGTGLAVNILNATNATSESVGEVSGSDVYYSGGGAAGGWNQYGQTLGSPGLGGGGAGGLDSAGGNGTPNTGGGGGAGDNGIGADHGGGGAGGLRTSYSNSSSINGHNESSLDLSVSTNYTVSVGAGGSAGGAYGGTGGSGVVILRYPSVYSIAVGSGIIEAGGSPFTESSDKISVFTAGTGTITFAEA